MGFVQVGTRKGYYNDGEGAVLMNRKAPVMSAREMTRLMAGLSPDLAGLHTRRLTVCAW
jgi:ribosomal-protein-alanine N-acetyltransferase